MGRTKSHSFIERNGLSSLLEHPIFPLMYLRHIIQWVGINRGILTNCLSYKISHLQISQKSLSNIIYFYILNYLQKHFIYLKQYWSNRFSYFGFKVTFVASIKLLIRMSICFHLLTMTEGVFWTSLFSIIKKKRTGKVQYWLIVSLYHCWIPCNGVNTIIILKSLFLVRGRVRCRMI